jgi:hypothetical protein
LWRFSEKSLGFRGFCYLRWCASSLQKNNYVKPGKFDSARRKLPHL